MTSGAVGDSMTGVEHSLTTTVGKVVMLTIMTKRTLKLVMSATMTMMPWTMATPMTMTTTMVLLQPSDVVDTSLHQAVR